MASPPVGLGELPLAGPRVQALANTTCVSKTAWASEKLGRGLGERRSRPRAGIGCRRSAARRGARRGQRSRKLLHLAGQRAVCVEQDGSAALVFVQQAGVLEVLHKGRLALQRAHSG